MVGARTLAMALNRLIDAELDARNPRTAGREIPAGVLSRAQVWALCAAALALYLVAAFQLEPIVRWLWPIPVVMFVVYPYLKRVTWLCHLWLGACTGLAPLGAWLAVTGTAPWEAWALFAAQGLWVAGFDLFYSLFDLAHDRADRPALVGDALRRARRVRRARARSMSPPWRCSRRSGLGLGSDVFYWLGVAAVAGLLALRAHARAPRRPPPARRRVLHRQRRDQRRLLRLRRRSTRCL